MKFKHFLDKDNKGSRSSILDGAHIDRTLTGVYFELYINLNGELNIDIERDQYLFYKNKLKKLYKNVYDLCLNSCKNQNSIFYNESSRRYCKLIRKVSAKISK